MKLEVLVVSTENNGEKVYQRMNINGPAIISCQNGNYNYTTINENVKVYSINNIGVGKNRNNALMHASGDICLLADDDIIYYDDYKVKVIEAYRRYPKADIILFNIKGRPLTKKDKKIKLYNYQKYGAVRISFKLKSILGKGIMFHTEYGGGSKYSCGEDSIFLYQCLKHKLKIVAVTEEIGELIDSESTWFNGYNDKFYYDKGKLFKFLYPKLYFLMDVQFCIRHRKLSERSILKNLYVMLNNH